MARAGRAEPVELGRLPDDLASGWGVEEDFTLEVSDEQKEHIASTTLEVSDLLTADECQQLIDAACQRAERVGWGEESHKKYLTEDVKIWNLEDLEARRLFEERVERPLRRALALGFRVPYEEVQLQDAFVVRYTEATQRSLDFHRDGSIFSGIVSLSPSAGYGGGGTVFEEDEDDEDAVFRPERGSGILFFGQRGHAGVEVTGGSRYILTLFFDFDAFTTEDLADMLVMAGF